MLRFSALARIIVDLGLSPELDATNLMARFVAHSTDLDFHQWVIREGVLAADELARIEREFDRWPFHCDECGAVRPGGELHGTVRLRCPVCRSSELRFEETWPEFDRLAREISGDEWELPSIATAPRFGDWLGIEMVGKGSCGTVYKAIHPGTGAVAAVKTLDVDVERIVQGFFHEAQLCAQIRHPHIVHVIDFGEVDGEPYIVMDWIDGITLDDIVEHSGPVDVDEGLRIGRQMALALQTIHDAGVVHRDIKPANIMITKDGNSHLMDFGIAKDLDWSITDHDIIFGTPAFMAPEQRVDTADVNAASDVYSLGATLYYAVSGETVSTDALIPGVALPPPDRPPPALRAVLPDAPEELDRLIARMCTFHAAERPTAGDVAEGLATIIDARGAPGSPPSA